MTALLALSRGIDWLNERIGRSAIWLILAAILISAVNAVVRKLLNTSSNAWLEVQWYLYGGAFMLAAAYTLKHNEHVRIDIFYASRSRRTQHWIDLFGHVLFLMPFVAIMVWMLVPYALQAWRSGQVSTNAGGLVIWPARFILVAGFVLLLIQGISEIIKKIAVIRGLIPDPAPFLSQHAAAVRDAAAAVEADRDESGQKDAAR
ncbi:TRAP-type mannitol/chloroaromatic compound transport system, small permease component [Rubellimicrobium thermophilum DSM 16684]|uniref:TRAP transporter small permease protein n=1 Tax=Rubellimicrobium thermophilum DSM 16684 TaxID=1123069 RepID=S9QX04_9RHOB|nr:TRAP transporter small permease subunit [Rubellimicrobium thermophilum]EPX85936.1 TRAP-type mannitol/chloroaromatic compound transport system, small permease component [Rubellimicrobium thermophilum DSM 16684]